jgi:very-short-patch-repair endonuclease
MVAELAGRQHGRVALWQLRELGLGSSGVRNRVAAGRLHPVHRGVYAVGRTTQTGKSNWMAAVLACGTGAVLSHRSAAALFGIRRSASATVDVTTPSQAGRKRDGIRVHDGRRLTRVEITRYDGIPTTTVARTLLDLAAVIDCQGLEKAINEAEVLQLFDLRAVNATLERAGRRRGTAALRDTLANLDPLQAQTRNELEQRFLSICRGAKLPLPEVNAWLTVERHRFQRDFLWRSHRLIVETDGFATHSTRRAFERDRRRDLALLRAGYRTVRVTWRQVLHHADEVAASIAPLLLAT